MKLFWAFDVISPFSYDMALDYLRDPRLFEDAEMKRLETLPVGVTRKPKA